MANKQCCLFSWTSCLYSFLHAQPHKGKYTSHSNRELIRCEEIGLFLHQPGHIVLPFYWLYVLHALAWKYICSASYLLEISLHWSMDALLMCWQQNNTLRPGQNGRHFADDIFKCIFVNENVWIPIKISLKFVPEGPINNIAALVQIMAWRRPGDKPLSEPMMVRLPTHISVTQPQWDKVLIYF